MHRIAQFGLMDVLDNGQIFCKADRQKTNDVRQVKESYEQKLAQTAKSANVEIHRLVSDNWEYALFGGRNLR